MLAGVGGIDVVLLVVAADESVMPQTREHFEICRLLRIPRGYRRHHEVRPRRSRAASSWRRSRRGSSSRGASSRAPRWSTSPRRRARASMLCGRRSSRLARRGAGDIRHRTLSASDRPGVHDDEGLAPWSPVPSSRARSGRTRRSRSCPGARKLGFAGSQVHGEKRDVASAGQRTAVNLQGVELDELDRGDDLTAPGTFEPTMMLDAELEVLRLVARRRQGPDARSSSPGHGAGARSGARSRRAQGAPRPARAASSSFVSKLPWWPPAATVSSSGATRRSRPSREGACSTLTR